MNLIQNPLKNEIWKSLNRYFPKDAHQKSEGEVSEVRFRKTRLLHLGNVEKPPHPHISAQRAPEGLVVEIGILFVDIVVFYALLGIFKTF